jgi:thiopurine S-methyltransferase
MNPEFWKKRWQEGKTGFHQPAPHTALERHCEQLAPFKNVLVPLAGKSCDLPFLAAQQHQVVGIELAQEAIDAFAEEQQLTFERSALGDGARYDSPTITMICHDFFKVKPSDVGEINAVYDRAAMVALPPDIQARYTKHLLTFLAPGSAILLISVEYNMEHMSGPPFSVPEEEVRRLYEPHTVTVLERANVIDDNPRFRERGIDALYEIVYLINTLSQGYSTLSRLVKAMFSLCAARQSSFARVAWSFATKTAFAARSYHDRGCSCIE